MTTVVINSTGGGLGDCVYLLWIAEGLRAVGRSVAFTRGSTDAIVQLFGHELTTHAGESLHDRGGYSGWELTVKGERLDRTRLWQRRLGVDVEPVRPTARIGEKARQWAAGHAESVCRGGRRMLLAFPYAHWLVRCWPMNKWRRLLLMAMAHGWGALAAHTAKAQLQETMPCAYVFGYGVEPTAALIEQAGIRGGVVLGCGSGGAVLAATMGVPTVAILGPDDPHISFGFSPGNTRCVVAESMACRSCRYDTAGGWEKACDFGCEALQSITTEQVWRTLSKSFPTTTQTGFMSM